MESPNIIVLALPVFFVSIAVEFAVSTLLRRKVYRLNDTIAALSLGIVSEIGGALFTSLNLLPYVAIRKRWNLASLGNGSFAEQVAVFVAIDFGYYLFHRWAHERSILYLSHSAHHTSEDYNASTALRQGLFEKWAQWVPFLLFAPFLDPFTYLWYKQVNAVFQFFVHTRLVDRMPAWYEFIFNTPSHHRVHHARNPIYIGKNYAGVFVIWDRMFGTYADETEECVYGLVEPLETWSPVTATVSHGSHIYHNICNSQGLFGKLKCLLMRPRWTPRGKLPYPEVNRKPCKGYVLDKRGEGLGIEGVMGYVSLHFVFVLIASVFFIFERSQMSMPVALVCFGAIMYSLIVLNMAMDGDRRAIRLEIIRMVVIVFALSAALDIYAIQAASAERSAAARSALAGAQDAVPTTANASSLGDSSYSSPSGTIRMKSPPLSDVKRLQDAHTHLAVTLSGGFSPWLVAMVGCLIVAASSLLVVLYTAARIDRPAPRRVIVTVD